MLSSQYPILLGDGKLVNVANASVETHSYCTRATRMKGREDIWLTTLGLAFTAKEAELTLAMCADGHVNVIIICSLATDCRAFFAILYGAVHYYIAHVQEFIQYAPGILPVSNVNSIEYVHENNRLIKVDGSSPHSSCAQTRQLYQVMRRLQANTE